MIEKISTKILNILSNENDDETQREILLFGITRIVEDVPKYIAIIIICAALGVLKEFALFMLVTIMYKTFTGGVHLHTNIGCFVVTIISTLMCIYLPKFMVEFQSMLTPFYIFVYIFSLYIIWIYVPADVPEIPVINEKRRKRDKILSLVMLNVLFLVSFIFLDSAVSICIVMMTILEIDLMTTRTFYRLFKNEYGYETYIPDELLMTE